MEQLEFDCRLESERELEENVNDGKTDDFLETITPIRKELLILRSYYDEIMERLL